MKQIRCYSKHLILAVGLQIFSISVWADWMQGIFDRAPLAGPCRKEPSVPEISLTDLWQEAIRLKENKNYCEAAAHYRKIRINELVGKKVSLAWLGEIESYFYQYDYDRFFDSALDYMQLRRGSEYESRVHYLVLKAVHELIQETKDLANPWLQFALGVHPEQLATDSPKNLLKFRSYFERHLESEYTIEVHDFLEQAKNHFNSDYLKQARQLVMRREYAPAIVRYQFLLNLGPEFGEQGVATYELVQALLEFSYNVIRPNVIATPKLARWLSTSEDEVTLQRREELAGVLQKQAERLFKMMCEKLPTDPWTNRGRRDFGISCEK